jgi:hypothetical protein
VAKRLGDPDKAGDPASFTLDLGGRSDDDRLPLGFVPALGRWTVSASETAPAWFLRQDATVDPWAVALVAGPRRAIADGKVSVRFRLISGREDQAAGVIVRARDAKSYYLARANGLEGNLRLYSMKDGNRSQLASVSVTPPTPNEWHGLEVAFDGPLLRATLDGKTSVEAKDGLFASGWVGLWTKADSVTDFADVTVTLAEPPRGPGR